MKNTPKRTTNEAPDDYIELALNDPHFDDLGKSPDPDEVTPSEDDSIFFMSLEELTGEPLPEDAFTTYSLTTSEDQELPTPGEQTAEEFRNV